MLIAVILPPLHLSGQRFLTLREPESVSPHVCVVTADSALAAPSVARSDILRGLIFSSDRISSPGGGLRGGSWDSGHGNSTLHSSPRIACGWWWMAGSGNHRDRAGESSNAAEGSLGSERMQRGKECKVNTEAGCRLAGLAVNNQH